MPRPPVRAMNDTQPLRQDTTAPSPPPALGHGVARTQMSAPLSRLPRLLCPQPPYPRHCLVLCLDTVSGSVDVTDGSRMSYRFIVRMFQASLPCVPVPRDAVCSCPFLGKCSPSPESGTVQSRRRRT